MHGIHAATLTRLMLCNIPIYLLAIKGQLLVNVEIDNVKSYKQALVLSSAEEHVAN